jgi:hypothetical protein
LSTPVASVRSSPSGRRRPLRDRERWSDPMADAGQTQWPTDRLRVNPPPSQNPTRQAGRHQMSSLPASYASSKPGRCDQQPAPDTPEHRYRPLHARRKHRLDAQQCEGMAIAVSSQPVAAVVLAIPIGHRKAFLHLVRRDCSCLHKPWRERRGRSLGPEPGAVRCWKGLLAKQRRKYGGESHHLVQRP